MAEHSENSAVFAFCDLLGLMLALPFGDALRGAPITPRMIVFASVGFLSAIFGHSWPKLSSGVRFPTRLSETVRTVSTDFRWWLAIILIAFVFGGPDVLGLLRSTFTPTVPQAPTTTMLDWNDVISLQDAIGTMKESCLMKLTANSGGPAQNIRNIIRRTVTELKGCEIYDAQQDDSPDFSPNADATPMPKEEPGLIVRWNTDTEAERLAGQNVFNALSRRFVATPGRKMPPNSPPNLIWVQVNGEPWREE